MSNPLKNKKKVDAIIFSPPFKEQACRKRKFSGKPIEEISEDVRHNPRFPGEKLRWVKYEEVSKENIGKLPHGKIDAIVFSPPYSEQKKGGEIDPTEMARRFEEQAKTHPKWNLWGRRSTPGRIKGFKSMGSGYGTDPQQIGNLPHGKIDTIVFSPPYAEAQEGGGIAKKGYRGSKHSETDLVGKRSYMPSNIGNKENISNKPYGEIDAIVFSPPYEKSCDAPEKHGSRQHRLKKAGYNPNNYKRPRDALWNENWYYSKNPSNIGNLPHDKNGAFEETEEEQVENVLFFKPTPGFEGYEQFFDGESVTHPAKANLNMLRWIIERFTEEGNVVLDPMAGTGSTGIIASYLGRRAVCIDLEQKFVDMMEKNIERFEEACMHWKVKRPQIVAMQGDSRQLSRVLSKVDSIIFSPPYSEIMGAHDAIWIKSKLNEPRKKAKGIMGSGRSLQQGGYPKDENNIGNLPHGKIDTIVTSPPYEQALGFRAGGQSKKAIEFVEQGKSEYESLQLARCGTPIGVEKGLPYPYSTKETQLGNLKGGTYLSAMLKVYHECWKVLKPKGIMVIIIKNFIRNKRIVRLDLDTIKLCQKAGFHLVKRFKAYLGQQSFWRIIYHQKYPNVDRIKYEHILIFEK